MPRNVVAADKDVNDNNGGGVYSRRYAVLVTTAARPYHHGNLREALLLAGEQALEAGGAQNLSLRELAREVGVSHAAPRRHFPDKQALLDALALSGWERLGAALASAVADARRWLRRADARPRPRLRRLRHPPPRSHRADVRHQARRRRIARAGGRPASARWPRR